MLQIKLKPNYMVIHLTEYEGKNNRIKQLVSNLDTQQVYNTLIVNGTAEELYNALLTLMVVYDATLE